VSEPRYIQTGTDVRKVVVHLCKVINARIKTKVYILIAGG
jgi:hypothetical protein